MPDVSRSDSQRSDTSTSLRPRVSFNRDVHVKRIVSRDSPSASGALSSDGAGHLVPLPVRKERLGTLSRKQLAQEAAKVIHQVDKVDCTTKQGVLPDKFYTLPTRKKHRPADLESPHSSQERINVVRRRSEDLSASPPKKPPRSFASNKQQQQHKQKNSLFKLFKKSDKEPDPKKSNLRRSVSDASNLKSKTLEKTHRKRSGSESEENQSNILTKKSQLSPIIEVSTPRDDYFSPKKDYFSDKENEKPASNKFGKFTSKRNEQNLKDVDEVDRNGTNVTPGVVVIDVEKAESISKTKNNKKLSSDSFKNKFKLLALKKDNKSSKSSAKKEETKSKSVDAKLEKKSDVNKSEPIQIPESRTSPIIQEAIKSLEESIEKSSGMIHSSQQPAEKIPLTRGNKVDTMIRRLNRDKSLSPPKNNTVLVAPTVTVAHNNNQPFSYTQPRSLSPERRFSKSPVFDKPSSPVIYAQVVVGNGDPDIPGSKKQTVHTTYNKKGFPHSDSDEGLGYEENINKKYIHFGDEKRRNESYKHSDKFEEEYPITPKFKSSNNGFSNGYDYNERSHTEHTTFIDSSVRGRGDGMDSRRKESLTEPIIDPLIDSKLANLNGRNDLSYRRDLLESRINSRRLGDKHPSFNDSSPEFSSKTYNPRVNKYVSETTSRYYRHGSTSPVGFTENYVSETKIGRNGEKFVTETRSHTNLGENNARKHITDSRHDFDYRNSDYERNDGEPKSLDSQISDYRSSPENSNNRKYYTSHENGRDYRSLHFNRYKQKNEKPMSKERNHYKSNPEIHHRDYEPSYKGEYRDHFVSETYHDSLRRQKHDVRRESDTKHNEKYFESDKERKDKFGDSGIENDFRRDSGENVRGMRNHPQHYRSNNESEDEGFASSLLITSERQHTEDNHRSLNRKHRKEYDSDKEEHHYRDYKDDLSYRPNDSMEYKKKHDYVHRERSIDDGSHYDPRIDKDFDGKRGTLTKVDSKPPKPAKISSLKKVKQLFTRDSSKKNKKEKVDPPGMVTEENLRARYKEYRGSNEALNKNSMKRNTYTSSKQDIHTESKREHYIDRRDNYSDSRLDNNSDNSHQSYDYSNRRRLSTPSPSPTRDTNGTSTLRPEKHAHDKWFKSLDRFSLKRNKSDKINNKENIKTELAKPVSTTPTKNLRFFGDTDLESNASVRRKSSLKSRPSVPLYKTPKTTKTRSQSTRNLQNISEEFDHSDVDTLGKYKNHKSMQDISETDHGSRQSKLNVKPPMSPTRRTDTLKSKSDSRNRKRRNEPSSVESSTEGDSSQQSQRSVVYLHAATVGDIPSPGYLSKNGRRAASKEDLISNGSSRMHTQTKTLSRSFSVLAPWKPKHAADGYDIDYSQQSSRPIKNVKNGSSKSGGKTAKEISNQKKMSTQNLSTLSRTSRSKENISRTLTRKPKDEPSKVSSTTLYKKKEKQPKENLRYSRDDKKISSKSMSVESLRGGGSSSKSREDPKMISRSISMPRDPEKSAGWFNKGNKKHKKNLSTPRL